MIKFARLTLGGHRRAAVAVQPSGVSGKAQKATEQLTDMPEVPQRLGHGEPSDMQQQFESAQSEHIVLDDEVFNGPTELTNAGSAGKSLNPLTGSSNVFVKRNPLAAPTAAQPSSGMLLLPISSRQIGSGDYDDPPMSEGHEIEAADFSPGQSSCSQTHSSGSSSSGMTPGSVSSSDISWSSVLTAAEAAKATLGNFTAATSDVKESSMKELSTTSSRKIALRSARITSTQRGQTGRRRRRVRRRRKILVSFRDPLVTQVWEYPAADGEDSPYCPEGTATPSEAAPELIVISPPVGTQPGSSPIVIQSASRGDSQDSQAATPKALATLDLVSPGVCPGISTTASPALLSARSVPPIVLPPSRSPLHSRSLFVGSPSPSSRPRGEKTERTGPLSPFFVSSWLAQHQLDDEEEPPSTLVTDTTGPLPPVDPSASLSSSLADDGKDLIVGLHVKHHIYSLHGVTAACKTCRAGDGAPPNGSTPNSQLSCTTANQDSSSSILSVASIANSADSVSFRNTTSVAQDSNEMAHGEGVLNSITSRPGILNPTPNIEIDHHTLGKGRTLEIDPRVHSLHDPAMLSIPLLSEFPSGSSCGEIRPKQASFIDHKRVASSVNCATNVSEQDYSSNRNVENDPHTHLRFVSMQNTDTALVEGSMKRLVSNSLPSNRMHSFHNASSNEFYPPKRPSSELLESMSAYATKCSTPIPDCDVANDINNRLEFKRDLNVSSYEGAKRKFADTLLISPKPLCLSIKQLTTNGSTMNWVLRCNAFDDKYCVHNGFKRDQLHYVLNICLLPLSAAAREFRLHTVPGLTRQSTVDIVSEQVWWRVLLARNLFDYGTCAFLNFVLMLQTLTLIRHITMLIFSPPSLSRISFLPAIRKTENQIVKLTLTPSS
eukprot:GHVT01061943.1.p1 GENE.GHVT01061943.1~~GHVT01061943.1.p1  ORF type:complete len:889 (-),score=49.00 GHVT01061943.1:2151-4817(-)